MDGAYVRAADGSLSFVPLPDPRLEQLEELTRRIAERVMRVLQKHGRSADGILVMACPREILRPNAIVPVN